MATTTSNVFDHLLGLCGPLRIPRAWAFLPVPADCRSVLADPAQALECLRVRFDRPALRKAGVVEVLPDGRERIAPELTNPAGALVALRAAPGKPVYGLVTARGCLPRRLNLLAVQLADHGVRAPARDQGTVYGVWRVADLVLFRALGLPAVLCLGLARQPLRRLRWLGERLAGDFQASTAPSTFDQLAILGCRPWDFAGTGALAAAAARNLVQARQFLGVSLAGMGVFRPAAADAEQLRFCLAHRDGVLVRQLFGQLAARLEDWPIMRRAGPQRRNRRRGLPRRRPTSWRSCGEPVTS